MSLAAVPEDSTTHFNNALTNLNRRRSLFPCEDTDSESDSDLGLSPLNFDSSFDKGHFNILTKQSQNVANIVGEYDIVENKNLLEYTPQGKNPQSEVMSPLYLSPHYNKMETTLAETPSRTSPFFNLKTPHDAPNTNSKLPKLSRKSLLDSDVSSNSNKRKLSPDKSPDQNKHIKLDPKSSRVRTTLFPEVDFALSTKSFYPKSEGILEKNMNKRDIASKSTVLLTANRKSKTRKKIGQINAGVGHKIRKPKHKKFTKTSLNSMGNSAITEYIMDLKELKSGNNPSRIENKENTQLPKKLITPAITVPQKTLEPVESKKRPLSPTFEPDLNKKFFKSSRTYKGVIKMNKNIQLEIDNGKLSILQKNMNKSKNDFDMTDLTDDDSEIPKTNIDSILSLLEDDKESIPQENIIILQATNSIVSSDNSILLHQPTCTADLILSPISQMCDVTSGLALNTPKKVKNLTPILEDLETNNVSDDQKLNKLFPVFYPGHTGALETKEKILVNAEKKFNKLPQDQMLIDAGQKKFGITQCSECKFVYHEGDPNDEIMHLEYHSARHIMKFPGWKNERVVADFQVNGRIIQILPGDSKLWWKKIKELTDAINRELGCYDMEYSLENCQAFLYIKKKTIIGCLIATPKTEGYQMLKLINEIDMCSQRVHPIKCGIPRIWVSADTRKLGIATQMMNALKKNFIQGSVLYNTDIAFSSPTDLGKTFAQHYFKTKHFFIYF